MNVYLQLNNFLDSVPVKIAAMARNDSELAITKTEIKFGEVVAESYP